MATTYKTPGVYIEEIPKLPPSVAEVETAIPAFIGYTQITNKTSAGIVPVRISSLLEYETLFGKAALETINVTIRDVLSSGVLLSRVVSTSVTAPSKNTMYYHMQMYFANGGGPCYIVSVGAGTGAIVKSDLQDGLTAIKGYDEPTLLLFPEGVNMAGVSAAGDLYDLYDLALQQCEDLKDRFVVMDCFGDDASKVRDASAGIGANNLKYGAAYHPFLNTSLNYQYDETTVIIDHKQDANNSGDFETTVTYGTGSKLSEVLGSSSTEKSIIYNLVKQAAAEPRITLNPSPTVVGVYATVDNARGVWKAPANVSLNNVNGLTKMISELDQAGLNVDPVGGKSINAIRAFTGRGILVWGARTLAGNDNEWRYVPVRRFFNMVEESVKKATEAFVFEPNDANTWVKVQSMIENFLTTLWRAGALQGAKPEHAFYVSVGLGKTMTALDILEGRMIVEIGMAAVRPAEFIILRFSHKMAES